jgi:hypothetical protein
VQSIIVGQEDGPYRYRTEIGTGLKRTWAYVFLL